MNVTTSKQRGFTLIEVILVLAIAALIFLMIFVALPALQASQRDTARKNDAGIVSSAVTKYTSGERRTVEEGFNAGGGSNATIIQDYVDTLDQYEVTGVLVSELVGGGGAAVDPSETEILVYPSAECDGSDAVSTTNPRKNAVRLLLDNGSSYYCVDAS